MRMAVKAIFYTTLAVMFLLTSINCQQAPPALHISVYDTEDPVGVGKKTTYVIDVRNESSSPATGLKLSCMFSKEMHFLAGVGPNVSFKVENNKVTFDTVRTLEAGQKLMYKVTCRPIEPGPAKFTSIVHYAEFSKEIIAEEETETYK